MNAIGLVNHGRRTALRRLAVFAVASSLPLGLRPPVALARSGSRADISLDIAPGVEGVDYVLASTNDAALKVIGLAEQAFNAGTFAVGGLLVDRSGRVLAQAVNKVIRDKKVADPTAHVERQLVEDR